MLPQEARMQDHATYAMSFWQFVQVFVDTFETQVKWGIRLRQRQHFRQRDQRSSEGCKNLSDPVPLLSSGRMFNFPPSPLLLSNYHPIIYLVFSLFRRLASSSSLASPLISSLSNRTTNWSRRTGGSRRTKRDERNKSGELTDKSNWKKRKFV